MTGRNLLIWMTFCLAAWLLVAGCNGVLFQKQDAYGRVDRLRLDGGEDWDGYDVTPRYLSTKPKDQDGYYMMLKTEKTF